VEEQAETWKSGALALCGDLEGALGPGVPILRALSFVSSQVPFVVCRFNSCVHEESPLDAGGFSSAGLLKSKNSFLSAHPTLFPQDGSCQNASRAVSGVTLKISSMKARISV